MFDTSSNSSEKDRGRLVKKILATVSVALVLIAIILVVLLTKPSLKRHVGAWKEDFKSDITESTWPSEKSHQQPAWLEKYTNGSAEADFVECRKRLPGGSLYGKFDRLEDGSVFLGDESWTVDFRSECRETVAEVLTYHYCDKHSTMSWLCPNGELNKTHLQEGGHPNQDCDSFSKIYDLLSSNDGSIKDIDVTAVCHEDRRHGRSLNRPGCMDDERAFNYKKDFTELGVDFFNFQTDFTSPDFEGEFLHLHYHNTPDVWTSPKPFGGPNGHMMPCGDVFSQHSTWNRPKAWSANNVNWHYRGNVVVEATYVDRYGGSDNLYASYIRWPSVHFNGEYKGTVKFFNARILSNAQTLPGCKLSEVYPNLIVTGNGDDPCWVFIRARKWKAEINRVYRDICDCEFE